VVLGWRVLCLEFESFFVKKIGGDWFGVDDCHNVIISLPVYIFTKLNVITFDILPLGNCIQTLRFHTERQR
jgi:hypothetical protein